MSKELKFYPFANFGAKLCEETQVILVKPCLDGILIYEKNVLLKRKEEFEKSNCRGLKIDFSFYSKIQS